MRTVPALLLLCLALPVAAGAQSVTVYRCTDGKGRTHLQDTPCRDSAREEIRRLRAPQAPPVAAPQPPPATTMPAPAGNPATAPPPRPASRTRLAYECTAPDGTRYPSENGEGRLRWQPLWVPVVPVAAPVVPPQPHWQLQLGGRHGSLHAHGGHGGVYPALPPGHSALPRVAPLGGSWVRDTCQPLPRTLACQRLADQRHDLLRRYGFVMPSERRAMDAQMEVIALRLAEECR